VGQGGSFVELDNVLRGGGVGGQDGPDGNDIDLDADDAEELPELAPPPAPPGKRRRPSTKVATASRSERPEHR
jgi:hypothetical protein